MRKINDILQTIHNYYDHGLHQNLLQCLTHPSAELTYQKLLELSTHLSQKVEFQNNQINFLPEISINDLAKLEKLGASIKHLKNCAKQVEKTTPFLERSQIDLNLCEGLENNTYDLLNESQQSLEITAIDFQYHDSYIVLGVIKDQKRNDIQIWDIDEQLNMRNLLNTLQGHQSQIQFLQISWQQLISIDSTSKMIFWSKQGTYRDWKYGREIHAEIQQINCIQYEFCYNYLALGGNSLKLWKLENQDRLNVINLAQSQMILNKDFITCLCFINKRQKLAAGTKQGKIWIFEEVENVWIIQQETQISQQQVRQIGFISQNDFISFSLGNLWTKWSYFTDTEYDFCSKFVSNMDDGLFVKDKVRMKYPMQITNGIQSLIISNLYSFSFSGKYLAIFKDNKIKLYKISQIQ